MQFAHKVPAKQQCAVSDYLLMELAVSYYGYVNLFFTISHFRLSKSYSEKRRNIR